MNTKARQWLQVAAVFRQHEEELRRTQKKTRYTFEQLPERLAELDDIRAFVQERLNESGTPEGARRIDIAATYQAVLVCPEAEDEIVGQEAYANDSARMDALYEHAIRYTKTVEHRIEAEAQQRINSGGSVVLKVFGVVALLFLVIGGLGAGWVWNWQKSMQRFIAAPASESSDKVVVKIPRRTRATEAVRILKDAGVISDEKQFALLVRFYRHLKQFKILELPHRNVRIRAGNYKVAKNLTPLQLLAILRKGVKRRSIRVTIPEGFDIWKISARLKRKGIINDRQKFLRIAKDNSLATQLVGMKAKSFEGYLYPDTYQFYKNTPELVVIKRMVRQFKRIYTQKFRDRARELNMTDQQVITLASIIERETGQSSERPLVSSVFHNRMRRKWKMESCATVIYGLLPNFNGNLTYKDLANPHEYNTYKHKGLPPGPIANPGRRAIYAALHPKKSCYMFFVSKNNGTHVFSCTGKQHRHWVNIYQKGGGRKNKRPVLRYRKYSNN
jgi:UPF0755 protein